MKTVTLYDLTRNRELIFIESFKELYLRVNSKSRDPYNLIRKSAILRFLIIDGGKFYISINRPYRIKIKMFLKGGFLQGHSLSSISNQNSYFTRFTYTFDESCKEIDISEFLKLPVIRINSPQLKRHIGKKLIREEYNVNQIIKLIANGHGGVHIEEWGNDIPGYILTDNTSPFNINTNSKLHDTIDNISELIIKTLEPLSKLVIDNLKTINGIAWESLPIILKPYTKENK